MGSGADGRAVIAILGCATLIFATVLIAIAFVGGIAITRIRAAAPTPTTARAVVPITNYPTPIPYQPPPPTPTLTTPTGVAFATRQRPAPPAATPRATPRGATVLNKVELLTNDLAYDPFSQLIWASVPGRDGARGNSVVPLDPQTGTIGQPILVGSEPTHLALSDDGHYLYVVLEGSATIRRVDLMTRRADLEINLGTNKGGQPIYPAYIAVLPGKSDAIAVVRVNGPAGSRIGNGDIAIYVEATQLPNTEPIDGQAIRFCGSADTLYAFEDLSRGLNLARFIVDSAGVRRRGTTERISATAPGVVHCDADRLYTASGQVVDLNSGRLIGTYSGLVGSRHVQPAATVGRTFFLTQIIKGTSTTPQGLQLLVFDQQTFRQIWSYEITELADLFLTASAESMMRLPSAFIRWGDDGVAFRANTQYVYFLRATAIAGGPIPATPPTGGTPRSSNQPAPTATPARRLPGAVTPTPTPTRSNVATPPPAPPRATAAGTSSAQFPPALGHPSARLRNTATINTGGGIVRAVAWSPDGTRLAVGTIQKMAQIWRADGTLIATLTGHTNDLAFVGWSADGTRLATAALNGDQTVRLWSEEGQPLAVIQTGQSALQGFTWSPDGTLLATLGDRTVKLWRADGTPVTTIGGLRFAISRVAWAPDSSALAFAPGDSSVQVWSNTGALQATFSDHPQPRSVAWIDWSPDSKLLASGDSAGQVLLWTRDGVQTAAIGTLNSTVMGLAWSPDGNMIAALDSDGSLQLWARDGATRYASELKVSLNIGTRLHWSPDGKRLALNVPDRFFLTLTLASNALGTLTEPYPAIGCFAWSPDSTTIATGNNDGAVQLWR